MVAAVAAVSAGVGLVGASMSADAAGDAAAGQERASAESNALQRYMYDNNVALQAPNINTGNAARDRLSFLLGLSPTGFSGGTPGGSSTSSTQPLTYEQLRAQLLGQYTSTGGQAGTTPAVDPTANMNEFQRAMYQRQVEGGGQANPDPGMGPGYWQASTNGSGSPTWVPGTAGGSTGPTSTIDETGLDSAIRARLAEQEAAQRAREQAAMADPNYGRLAQQFQFDTYTPDKFSYTGEDLYDDPSYQWRLSQGQKALDRSGAAAGRLLSGRQLQAASDYNQGAASQEFQAAYGRAANTFGTNEGNRFNAFTTNQGNRFNAFQANFNNSVNPLLALSGAATLGSQNLGAAGATMAGNVGNTLMNQANATGAAGIATANSISNGLNGAVQGYQQNQLLSGLLNRNSNVNNNPMMSNAMSNGYGNTMRQNGYSNDQAYG